MQLKGKYVISVTRLALHYNRVYQQEIGIPPQAQRNQASNRKSTLFTLLHAICVIQIMSTW